MRSASTRTAGRSASPPRSTGGSCPCAASAASRSAPPPGSPGPQPFKKPHWLDQLTAYLAQILDSIPAPLNAVRLMALGPGAVSNPHSDPKYRLDRGLVRLHIPIITDPGAVLVLDGVEHCWQAGCLWFGDFSREHLVRNTSQTVTRVHVVMDTPLTADLAAWFPDS
nr:aspartyl/asparaginyl beta-hydroxylase domain-containing protein [Streptomyces durmitorensis]